MKNKNVFDNLIFIAKNWIRWDKKGTVVAFLKIPVAILIPIAAAFFNKAFVELIADKACAETFVAVLGAIFLLTAVLNWLLHLITEKTEVFQLNISIHYAIEAFEKLLKMDYELLESYDGRAKFDRCRRFALEGSNSDGAWAVVRLIGLAQSLFGILTYASILSVIHPILVLVILVTCALESATYHFINKIAAETEDKMVDSEMKFSYFFRVAADSAKGKDIRLTGAAGWLKRTLNKSISAYMNIMHAFTSKTTKLTALQALCAMVRDAAIFGFLIWSVLKRTIAVSDFVFCFELAAGFTVWINGVAGHVASLKRISVECGKYREFMAMDKKADEKKQILREEEIKSVEFRDVCFGYEENHMVLKHISFTIKKGERIAVVGENGAGKTTLIKLLCGLYTPTSGQILINGQDLRRLDVKAYFKSLSVLFQDYTLLPMSIAENITLSQPYDRQKAKKVLVQVGLTEKVKKLKDGLDTKLGQRLNEQTASLSGGELQRLLFARALYKDSPILILDEPTAALDPLAEEALYLQYFGLTKDKISVFISHRLNSTKFSDRILFMRDGEIAEQGNHEELMALRGNYWDMYNVQGFYYREERA